MRTARLRSSRSAYLFAFLLAAPCAAPRAQAGLNPASQPGLEPQSVQVLDENDQLQDLRRLAQGSPALILPLFTKCPASCPLMIGSLKSALASRPAPFRVVAFSFDSTDTAADLKALRARQNIPSDWILVRSKSDGPTRAFFDQFNYNIMKEDGGFNHPNLIFVMSGDFRWSGSFYGADARPEEMRRAYRQAQRLEHPTFWGNFEEAARRPESWILFGSAAFVAGLGIVFLLAGRR